MLQQILKDMYIDPDVLDALNEDQKKTLFLKMRQEQVRRWQEREDKLEREGGDAVKRTKPKKDSKSVSWLLGRDGDVAVIVIGEVDELSAKFICSGLEEKKSPPSLQNNSNNQSILTNRKTTEPNRTERETISTVTYGLQVNKVSVSEHSSPPAADKIESKVASKPQEKFAPHTSICSRPPLRASPVDVTAASATAAPGSPYSRPGAAGPRLTAATLLFSSSSTAKTEPGNTSKAPCTQENHKPQEAPRSKDGASSRVTVRSALEDAVSSGNVSPPCAGRGRVAQLMKAFNTESSAGPPQTPGQTPTRGTKPPLPIKPSHLRATTTPSVR